GPVFANLVLADEINRAPAKVQSALLEVMQERQVTIAGESYAVPRPVIGMAIAVSPVTSTDALLEMQAAVRRLYVDPSLMIYAVKLVAATRAPDKCGLPDSGRFIQYGASSRA